MSSTTARGRKEVRVQPGPEEQAASSSAAAPSGPRPAKLVRSDTFVRTMNAVKAAGNALISDDARNDNKTQEGEWRKRKKFMQGVLDEPKSSRTAMVWFVTIIMTILLSVVVLCVETLDEYEDNATLEIIDIICTVVFTLEVITRFLIATSARQLFCDMFIWIDIVSVVPTYAGNLMRLDPSLDGAGTSDALVLLRLLRLLRLLKLARHYEGSMVLIKALQRSSGALIVPLFFLLVTMLLFAGVIYIVEGVLYNSPDFDNIFSAMWFMLVTLTTVGYGDIYPESALGKVIAAVAIMCGVLFMAMPITIVGNSFAVVWEEREALKVVMRVQRLLLHRGLHAREVILVFKEFDSSGDGQLDYDEFKNALSVLEVALPPAKVRQLFRMFDSDGSGEVQYEEFCSMIFPDMEDADVANMIKALSGPKPNKEAAERDIPDRPPPPQLHPRHLDPSALQSTSTKLLQATQYAMRSPSNDMPLLRGEKGPDTSGAHDSKVTEQKVEAPTEDGVANGGGFISRVGSPREGDDEGGWGKLSEIARAKAQARRGRTGRQSPLVGAVSPSRSGVGPTPFEAHALCRLELLERHVQALHASSRRIERALNITPTEQQMRDEAALLHNPTGGLGYSGGGALAGLLPPLGASAAGARPDFAGSPREAAADAC